MGVDAANRVFGVHGCYLRVDLSSGESHRVPIPESLSRATLGGVGLAAWLLTRETPPGLDPFDPRAALVFAFSPLVGSPITTSAKFAVAGKSPLTGMFCDALSSSHFAIAGKAMGVDALVFVGACAAPQVFVEGRLEPTDLWGASAAACDRALRSRGRVAAIGPAGEQRVRFATISNDGRHAGRGGLGAIMGAKKLKAIVVRGDCTTRLAHPERVSELARGLAERSRGQATAKYRELGTASNLTAFQKISALPTHNFKRASFDASDALSVETLREERPSERASCAACTIGCEHRYTTKAGTPVRLEYENLFALGPLCGIGDSETVLRAAERCDTLGLDAISAGGTIAFAMECGERGLLPGAPAFGDGDGLLAALDQIAARRGLGALLADGSRLAAAHIGGDSHTFAAHVKGLELPGYEPRALHATALGFAVSTRGADHNRSSAYDVDFSPESTPDIAVTARQVVKSENRSALLDSLILCKFLRGVFDDLYAESAELLNAVTGWGFDANTLEAICAKIVCRKKAYNIREGWRQEDDTLPARFTSEALPDGPRAGARLDAGRLKELVRSYYRARGWCDDGSLPEAVVAELERDGAAPNK